MPESLLDSSTQQADNSQVAQTSEEISKKVNDRKAQREIEQAELQHSFSRERLQWHNLDWTIFIWMVIIHASCFAAPFFFSWSALGLAFVLHWMTASIGICLGYHRYLAHRSLKLSPPAEFFVLLCGMFSGEGTPLNWSATHRLHHQRSDQPGDPHSPLENSLWSHIYWIFIKRSSKDQQTLYRRYVPELLSRPIMRFFEKTQGVWLTTMIVTIFAAGWGVGLLTGAESPLYSAIAFVVWAVSVRMVFAYHSTWFVNSATHLWGYRNYETRDQSRNLWWVAILAYGEGWHNNHHAHPSVAPAGHRWWEVDITWWTIKALRFVGLATDVNDRIPQQETSIPSVDEEDDKIQELVKTPAQSSPKKTTVQL